MDGNQNVHEPNDDPSLLRFHALAFLSQAVDVRPASFKFTKLLFISVTSI